MHTTGIMSVPVRTIHNWHRATDERSLSQEDCSRFNKEVVVMS